MYAWGMDTLKTYESVQEGGGPKSINIECTCFLNGPKDYGYIGT